TKTLSIPNMGGLAKVLPITFALFVTTCLASLALPGMSGFVSEITVFLGITSNDNFTIGFRVVTVVLAAIGLVLTPMYLLSMCRRVFFGPRIPALAVVGVVPTLMIGFWPRLATGIYDATTDSIAASLNSSLLAVLEKLPALG
ncbi:MAG: NAD(P)H-quinone oxidoreductase subunit 4, partial [Synechococcaceae bacterium WB6_3B_236]|nr:NAD(P)H-quinone oxidoreductase subunit 4 [Synechococcaceae bacterium WB6_3B_236]